MKKLLTLVALVLPTLAFAQWRVGVNGGATYNHSTISKHYMTDFQWDDRWGVTFGVMGQYDVNDWLGVRAELDWTQKNYRLTRQILSNLDYKYVNNYLQLPVMASFSFGGKQLRGFCNAGVYGGYWLTSGREGTDFNNSSEKVYEFSENIEFNDERDQRFDFGFVGGIGVEYRFCQRWAAQVEMRYYYSTVSTQKDYMRLSDPRYNSTLGVQAGLWYNF